MFYGRENELSKLNKLYDSGEFHCAVIYGRRRVGKTTLIGEFCKDKKNLFFSSLESTAKENMEVLSKTINEFLYPGSKAHPTFASFTDALIKISEVAKDERFVFVIDEFPYLAGADRSVSSALQHAIDHHLSKTNIFLIICGSSMSFMENQVLGYNSPLYGRRTAQFKLEPLNYLQSAKANPNLSPETNALIYGISGGIPHYINKLGVKTDSSIHLSIIENVLERTSYLFEEPANLLKQELREPASYNAIIAAMASGSSRLNEISTKTSLEYALCSKYLATLISLGIAGKKNPVHDTTKNKSLYYIKDNLFKFWYRFIPDNMPQLMAGKGTLVYENEIKPYLNEYMGKVFEDICEQFLIYVATDLPFPIKKIGSWWGGNPKTKQQEEIDILATNGKSAIFAECKWQREKATTNTLENLKRKAELFSQFTDKYFYIFSKSDFADNLKEVAKKEPNIRLISLADIYG